MHVLHHRVEEPLIDLGDLRSDLVPVSAFHHVGESHLHPTSDFANPMCESHHFTAVHSMSVSDFPHVVLHPFNDVCAMRSISDVRCCCDHDFMDHRSGRLWKDQDVSPLSSRFSSEMISPVKMHDAAWNDPVASSEAIANTPIQKSDVHPIEPDQCQASDRRLGSSSQPSVVTVVKQHIQNDLQVILNRCSAVITTYLDFRT